jgi:hypothetical protein
VFGDYSSKKAKVRDLDAFPRWRVGGRVGVGEQGVQRKARASVGGGIVAFYQDGFVRLMSGK